jgi:hypothetical protein
LASPRLTRLHLSHEVAGEAAQIAHPDIFATLDARAFQSCFVAWVAALTNTPAEVIAIDGKTSRRSYQTKGSKEAIQSHAVFKLPRSAKATPYLSVGPVFRAGTAGGRPARSPAQVAAGEETAIGEHHLPSKSIFLRGRAP